MTVSELCARTRSASPGLANSSAETRNSALSAMSAFLVKNAAYIISENEKDISAARQNGMAEAMVDRLRLDEKRIAAIAEGIEKVAALPDPLAGGESLVRPNGLVITKKPVPFGVIAMIYESRPNVTADAAALCVKSGNAVVLRGGKEAISSNAAIAETLSRALESCGLPGECIGFVRDTSRESANALMQMNGLVDLLIPRGGRALIRAVVENASVPVIETGAGNCHVFVDSSADEETALNIVDNAKRSRPSVCNAAESLLVCRDIAPSFLPNLAARMPDVEFRCDEESLALIPGAVPACEEDFFAEYNDLVMSVKVVSGVREAVSHINSHGTKHSECIVTRDGENAGYFLANVDAAAVYHNASTRFTDGGEFGFGAEIGISTQKLHARGPMGLKEMTTYKYIVRGEGQIR